MGVFRFVLYPLMLLMLTQAVYSKGHKPPACKMKCGNITISYPFGIDEGCYTNSFFQVSCNKTGDHGRRKSWRPFLTRLNLEILYIYSQSIVVNNPVIYFNCGKEENSKVTGAFTKILRDNGSPYNFSSQSYFGSVGYGHDLVTVLSNRTPIDGCLQAGDAKDHYCYATRIPENLDNLAANMTQIIPGAKGINRCSSAFIFDPSSMMDSDGAFPRTVGVETKFVPAALEWDPNFKCDLGASKCKELAGREPQRSSCKRRCGAAHIEWPFGIETNCYLNVWFKVTCNDTEHGGKAFLTNNDIKDLELLNTSFPEGHVLVNHPITYSTCSNRKDRMGLSVNLTSSPFLFSTSNRFASLGCGNLAIMYHNQTPDSVIGGCLQKTGLDDGTVGCSSDIPSGLSSFAANISGIYPSNCSSSGKDSCSYAFMIDRDSWMNLTSPDQIISSDFRVPSRLQFGTPKAGLCELKEGSSTSCSSDRKYCWTNLGSSHLCVCTYENSDYTGDVCTETGKCGNNKYRWCYMLCLNEPGGKYCSPTSCPTGYQYDKTLNGCKLKQNSSNKSAIFIGCGTSIGTLLLLLATWCGYKLLKRRRKIRRRQRYFKQNGGLLLRKQLSCNDGKIETIRFFTSKELEKATDRYNENRILGHGGQGTVYKGMLADGRIVGIKKSKEEKDKKKQFSDDKQLQQWVNEVMILSQINHRNVVRLLGCCLETKFPLLVYEFIPNGTLFELIKDQTEEFPLTWEMRLRISIEAANAISYLHSAACVPIYHRDVKSTNILLDDKYRAKVSDFGISKSVGLEQTHLTTQVQGTFGYLDPEYFRSYQFTEKSDVYSFGVVMAELLTGQKPFSSVQVYGEVTSLVQIFLLAMEENTLFDILDPRVTKDGPREEIVAVAKLAKRCLNLTGKKRPTMKQVASELESIRAATEDNSIKQINDFDEDSEDDGIEPWTIDSCSTTSMFITNSCVTMPLVD